MLFPVYFTLETKASSLINTVPVMFWVFFFLPLAARTILKAVIIEKEIESFWAIRTENSTALWCIRHIKEPVRNHQRIDNESMN